MGKSITAIIPVSRSDLTPVFIAGVVGLMKSRLTNLTLGNSGKMQGSNGWGESAQLSVTMSESLESWLCVFPSGINRGALRGAFTCHGDYEEVHRGFKLLFSVDDTDEMMQVLLHVTRGFGGFIERNGEIVEIAEESVMLKQVAMNDKAEKVMVDGGDVTLPSILYAFKQSYLLEVLPIPKGLIDTVYLNEYTTMLQIGFFSVEDRNWSLFYKLPEDKSQSESLVFWKYPHWASHVIQHKTKKDLRRCAKLHNGKMLGGYELSDTEFTVEYSADEWELLYEIKEESARIQM